jgi:hypothetical protein
MRYRYSRKRVYGLNLVDTELEKYGDLVKELPNYFSQIKHVQEVGIGLFLWHPKNLPKTRSLSGDEYLILPLKKGNKNLALPEMSIHFLIMYLLGMVSRYYPKEWGEKLSRAENLVKYISFENSLKLLLGNFLILP